MMKPYSRHAKIDQKNWIWKHGEFVCNVINPTLEQVNMLFKLKPSYHAKIKNNLETLHVYTSILEHSKQESFSGARFVNMKLVVWD